MELIRVNTRRGLELKGAMFGNTSMETVVIIMSGICSNVFQNDLLYATGKLLSKNNIACIIGHAMDAFSCFAYTDHSIGKQKNTGVYNDDFSLVYEDVESYVKYARGFMEKINSYCRNPQANQVIVIDDASHIFYGKHDEYAKTILDILKTRVFLKV